MKGLILGNRYELLEKIGGGGMALVYKAKCKLLDRYVAVKILRPEFTNDDEFVKRFRIEAQSAASLSHPNIVSIHDVGHEDTIHYIVMEYVDGITLKEYIQNRGALPWKEAVNIAIQICSAIEHAHRNHIVHRDIKPHNILLTKDGIAKVTDFGIARAVSSSTITMVGSTIGSVHYFSPEQARGGYTDEKSDLYSLGITLYEMVTGKLPFDGETPVAIALKHIQDSPKEPQELNERLPRGVNDIIVKAIKKEQSARYQNASEMLSDLNRVLTDPYGDFSKGESGNDIPTKKIKAIGNDDLVQKVGNDTEDNEVKKNKKDKLAVVFGVIIGLIIVGIFAFIGYKLVIPAILPDTPEITVENYVGRSFEDVRDELKDKNIEAKEKDVYNDSVQKGAIISQSIDPGQTLKPGGENFILFEVSLGTELVKIPDLRDEKYREAEAALRDLKLKVNFQDEYNDEVGTDLVIRTEPTFDTEVKPESEVTIFRSLGPELAKVKIPNLVGLTRSQAQQILLGNKLKLGRMEFPGGEISEVAKVTRQYPESLTEVDEDTPVDIYFTEDAASGTGSTTQPSGNNDGNQGAEVKRNNVETSPINLSSPDDYGNTIKVQVEITPSDTNKAEILLNENKDKSSFPLKLQVPVPENGKTKVRVLLDGKDYAEFYVQ